MVPLEKFRGILPLTAFNKLGGSLPKILESRITCFTSDKAFGLVGFSNGGYFLTKLYVQKMSLFQNLKPTELIASGSAKGLVPKTITDLSVNPKQSELLLF